MKKLVVALASLALSMPVQAAENFEYRAQGFELHKAPQSSAPTLCGTPDLTAKWHLTNLSVFVNIAREFGEDCPDNKFNMQVVRSVERKLRQVFRDKEIDCIVTIKPNGHIEKIDITKSSESVELDKLALNIIQKAAPFKSNDSKDNLWCRVHFPQFNPSPIGH